MTDNPFKSDQRKDTLASTDTSLIALRKQIERVGEKIAGNTIVLQGLADRVANQGSQFQTRDRHARREA